MLNSVLIVSGRVSLTNTLSSVYPLVHCIFSKIDLRSFHMCGVPPIAYPSGRFNHNLISCFIYNFVWCGIESRIELFLLQRYCVSDVYLWELRSSSFISMSFCLQQGFFFIVVPFSVLPYIVTYLVHVSNLVHWPEQSIFSTSKMSFVTQLLHLLEPILVFSLYVLFPE